MSWARASRSPRQRHCHHCHRSDGQRGPPGCRAAGCRGIHARVINIHTIKPLDEEIVLKAAKECGKVITAEEHSVIGGLGEAVCAVLSEKLPTPVRRVGVQDKFGCSGPAWDLLKLYGLDAATICKTAHEMLADPEVNKSRSAYDMYP